MTGRSSGPVASRGKLKTGGKLSADCRWVDPLAVEVDGQNENSPAWTLFFRSMYVRSSMSATLIGYDTFLS